jgi:tRNA threonylcarbamoyl adenosine modification protein YeaZ
MGARGPARLGHRPERRPGRGQNLLAAGLARGLGVTARVQSPTFALVNEYRDGRLPLFHLDLYRLASRDDIIPPALNRTCQARRRRRGGMDRALAGGRSLAGRCAASDFVALRSRYPAKRTGKYRMKILAVEFSSEQRSVAVCKQAAVLPPRCWAAPWNRASIAPSALVEEALRQARCEREEIETIAVGLGPGSYTGIRGAIALAQGWQLGRGVNVIGLSSVECLAAGAEQEKIFGPVNIIVDAQRQEFYLARYEIGPARGAKWKIAAGLIVRNCGLGRAWRAIAWAGRGRIISVRAKPLSRRGDFGTCWQLIGATLCPAKSWNRFTCGKPPSKRRRLHERSSYFRGRLAE